MKAKTIIFFVLIFSTFLDILTTIIIKYTKPAFNETSPVYLSTGNIWVLFALKILAVIAIIYLILTQARVKEPVFRHVYIFQLSLILVIFALFQLGAAIGNYKIIKSETAAIVQMPKEELQQHYTATQKPVSIIMAGLVIYTLSTLAFIVSEVLREGR
jgi:hypothetical protein